MDDLPGSLDGMQAVGGSNPLSSTRHNASAALPLRAVCQQIVSRSRRVAEIALCVLTDSIASFQPLTILVSPRRSRPVPPGWILLRHPQHQAAYLLADPRPA
jgi:hypothetical protein